MLPVEPAGITTPLIFLIGLLVWVGWPYEKAIAQPFGPQNVLCAGQLGVFRQLSYADLDQDGLPDILATCKYNTIFWYRNLGDGDFAFQEDLLKGYWSLPEFCIADFNGDGYPDLALSSQPDNFLGWSRNLGNGTFDTVIAISGSIGPMFLLACDLDADGDQDLLLTSHYSHSICYVNDGAGGFTYQELIFSGPNDKVLDARDMDNDGDIDLVRYDGGSLVWMENTGPWTFDSVHFIADVGIGNVYHLFVDLDGDGDDDLVYYAEGYEDLAWIENINNYSSTQYHHIQHLYPVYSIGCGDMNNDGHPDILVGSDVGTGILLYINDGNENFGEGIPIYTSGKILGLVTADFNLDGDMDFAVFQDHRRQTGWFENTGSFNFNGPNLLSTILLSPVGVTAIDMDGDGGPDILAASGPDNLIAGFFNTGYHVFDQFQEIYDTDIFQGEINIIPCDFDHDNHPDLLVNAYTNFILFNDGNGNIEFVLELEGIVESEDACIEDLDGDGWEDVIVAAYTGIVWFKNLGNRTFGKANYIDKLFDYGNRVTTGDLDNDGDAEIIYTCPYGNRVMYVNNEGQGNFSTPVWITQSSSRVYQVEVVDIDADDDLDVIVSFSNKVLWYENLGGVFSGVENVLFSLSNPVFYFEDFFNDGKPDLILAGNDNYLYWSENDGAGVFNDTILITDKIKQFTRIYTFDLDNDGDHDILTSSTGDGRVAWYENLSTSLALPENAMHKDSLQVYPIPAKDYLYIQFNSGTTRSINILDLNGKVIYRFKPPEGKNEIRLDISDLRPGIYVMKVEGSSNEVLIRRIIKI